LRVGASYEATCVALERHGIIDAATRERLTAKPRHALKAELLGGFAIDNYYPDVWLLTERDEGLTIEGQPDDLFVLRLSQKDGAGYLWTTAGLIDAGFAILRDQREIPSPEQAVRGPVTGVYRSHYYVQRALGNLFGLAHLQHFIAQETGQKMGPLVCHSSMAQLDLKPKR
jgi:hypothetical protein